MCGPARHRAVGARDGGIADDVISGPIGAPTRRSARQSSPSGLAASQHRTGRSVLLVISPAAIHPSGADELQTMRRGIDARLATLTTLAKAGQASWCSGADWMQGGGC